MSTLLALADRGAHGVTGHTAEEWTRFVGTGVANQVFARDRRDPPDAKLVFLSDGDADALREQAREHLMCPLPGCPSPQFTTRGGKTRRDHFVHLVRSEGHSYESLAHHTAKHLLARRVAQQHPGLELNIDDRKVESGQLPDVLVTSPSGLQVSLEVQYSPLTAGAWRARHTRFSTAGVSDQWFWGHRPPNFRRRRSGNVLLNGAHAATVEAGLPLLWINPFSELVAWWVPDLNSDEAIRKAQDASWLEGHDVPLHIEPVSELRFFGPQLLTAALAAALTERQERFDRRRAEAQRQAREQRERQRHERELEEQRRERRRRERQRERQREQQRRAARETEWEDYRQRVWPHRVPKLVASPSAKQYGVDLEPPHWRSIVYNELVAGRVGTYFDLHAEVSRLFADRCRDVDAAVQAVRVFLFNLRKHGFVAFHNSGFYIVGLVLVLRDFTTRGRKLETRRDAANTITYVVVESGEVFGRIIDPRNSPRPYVLRPPPEASPSPHCSSLL